MISTRIEALDAYRAATKIVTPRCGVPYPDMDLWGYLRDTYSSDEVEVISKWVAGRWIHGIRDDYLGGYWESTDPDFAAIRSQWEDRFRKEWSMQREREERFVNLALNLFWLTVFSLAVIVFVF